MTRAHRCLFVLGVGLAGSWLHGGIRLAGAAPPAAPATPSPQSPAPPAPPPSLDAADLARGPFSAMHMLLQKTILKINIATIDIRFDRKAQARFADLARGKTYSGALDQQLGEVAIGAEHAVVQMQFKHDVSLNRWMGAVRDNLEQAREAGLISRDLEQRVGQRLPQRFEALHDRGYEKGDRLLYELGPDSLRTVVVSTGGQILLDRTERDQETRRVVLASYFAPKSDFRELLLRSLLEPAR